MYSGEFTIELINRGRYQCEYCGTPRNIHTQFLQVIKRRQQKYFQTTSEPLGERRKRKDKNRQKQEGKKNVN